MSPRASTTEMPAIERLEPSVLVIPTPAPESDGTLVWDHTTMVIVEVAAAGAHGLGYSYTHAAAAAVIEQTLADIVVGTSPLAHTHTWMEMRRALRNAGTGGIAAGAISAVDMAIWDLRAQMLDLPLVSVLGAVRASVPAYGSGGFTSYSIAELEKQLSGFAAAGMGAVKMKVGREPARDVERMAAARAALPAGVELYIDANGAYRRKQALSVADRASVLGVTWFEEPVTSDDHEGLRVVRDGAASGVRIAAGEYIYAPEHAGPYVIGGAVDVLQADVTRCFGVTGFLRIAAMAEAFNLPLSAHTAPAAHIHLGCALPAVISLEHFVDHVRIEEMLFDGARAPVAGNLSPDLSRAGMGISLRRTEAARFAA
ncbi:MAG TPA: enolase C-terminal domain-like protein [Kofleriaceae bacterium]|nr:enolase C-terminal domain-like protein [Kofleriaceae bacterium]